MSNRKGETVLAWEAEDGSEVVAIFDVSTNETHERSNLVTNHPIEAGADAADHVQVGLPTFSIEGYVSNSPLPTNPGVIDQGDFKQIQLQIPSKPLKIGVSALVESAIDALGSLISGQPEATMFTFDNFKDRVRAAEQILEEARVNARMIRVITSVSTLPNMQIQSLVITRTPDDGTGATFALSLGQVRIVSAETVDAPEPAELTGAPRTNAGSKHAKEDDEKVEAKKKSVLKQGKDLLTGALGL
jgi:hypothetical protein